LTIIWIQWYTCSMQSGTAKWEKQKGAVKMLETLNPDTLICVYCEQVVAEKIDYSRTQICVPCNEYKSVTTVREYLEVYAW